MSIISHTIAYLVLVISLTACFSQEAVQVGLDQIGAKADLFKGKRLGIITNHTACDARGVHIIDNFFSMSQVQVTAVFGPEHGIRGKASAGEKIANTTYAVENIPVFSLYGETRKPSVEMLKNVDLLIFDIQDIGSRFYTYIYTMALAMEAAAESGIPFMVLDRPNPINGIDIEGNLLEAGFATFVGLYPIPVRHGLTIAELANLINEKGWLKNGIKADLSWISLKNWKREMWFDQTGLVWRPPSPNMPDLATAIVYPGTCLFEGTNISEGRGTYKPFQLIGAPWFKEADFFMLNQILDLPGVHFGPISFSPIAIPAMAPSPKFEGQTITGISIAVTNRKSFRPYLTGIALVKYFYESDKQNFLWREQHFDRLCGSDKIRHFISAGKKLEEIKKWIEKDVTDFRQDRKQYLLY